MLSRGIRGAITVDRNTESSIREATLELLKEMIEKNNVDIDLISHVIFTLTEDLNAAFPAKFARKEMGFSEVPMMCFHELEVPGAVRKCLRILMVVNCGENFQPEFVYLKDAQNLRR